MRRTPDTNFSLLPPANSVALGIKRHDHIDSSGERGYVSPAYFSPSSEEGPSRDYDDVCSEDVEKSKIANLFASCTSGGYDESIIDGRDNNGSDFRRGDSVDDLDIDDILSSPSLRGSPVPASAFALSSSTGEGDASLPLPTESTESTSSGSPLAAGSLHSDSERGLEEVTRVELPGPGSVLASPMSRSSPLPPSETKRTLNLANWERKVSASGSGSGLASNLSSNPSDSSPIRQRTASASMLRAIAATEGQPGASWAAMTELRESPSSPLSDSDNGDWVKAGAQETSPASMSVLASASAVAAAAATMASSVSATPLPVQTVPLPSSSTGPSPPGDMRALLSLLSDPSNRSCADCRSPLLDSSKIYASFYIHDPGMARRKKRLALTTGAAGDGDRGKAGDMMGFGKGDGREEVGHRRASLDVNNGPRVLGARVDFKARHEAFTPVGMSPRSPSPNDLALIATSLAGGHGVFLCPSCARAHRSLGRTAAIVKSVRSSAWTHNEVDVMLRSGGNARARTVYERYVPERWRGHMVPSSGSRREEREVWVRAKYECMAFVFPNSPLSQVGPGPFSSAPASALGRMNDISPHSEVSATAGECGISDASPRLVDYFCVTGSNGQLARDPSRKGGVPDISTAKKPEELIFNTAVLDCYPPPGKERDSTAPLPEHVSKFVFPEGCRPRSRHLSPMFFMFTLTVESGARMYGAAMHIYDDAVEMEKLRTDIIGSGYDGSLPGWLHPNKAESEGNAVNGMPLSGVPDKSKPQLSGVVYMPKCLVLLSLYPFFDLFRTYLRTLYRISLSEGPLPMERYISNFIREVPLPPQGRIEVRYHLTDNTTVSISRPPMNRLPLAGFSYRPLFASLSAGNMMVVIGCLLRETRVALCSRQYSLLTPVAEGLLSLLFPLVWQGMYVPVMPYSMLDVLDAPVPFLVGLHGRYLSCTPPAMRPIGVVFVDLDEDVIHLGFDDSQVGAGFGGGNGQELYGRPCPPLPDRVASKLKSKLEEYGGSKEYLLPACGVKGRVTYGAGEHMPNSDREGYAHQPFIDVAGRDETRRAAVLNMMDKVRDILALV